MIRNHDRIQKWRIIDTRKLSVKSIKLSIKYLIASFSCPAPQTDHKCARIIEWPMFASKRIRVRTIIKSAGVAEKERFEDRFDAEINVIN